MRRYLTLVISLLAVSTARADPARLAWIGVERGPLPPAQADQLERLLLDDLDGYDSFRLVDASGHALDARLLAAEAALVARLKDEAINLALEFKTPRALKKFDQAIAVFETRLVQLLDYELFHDTLLAKAEAQFQSGERTAAKTTLKQLAALSPAHVPTIRTHPAGLVRLWTDAKEELGAAGTINVRCDGCTVQIDGQPLGHAPLLATRILPGKHYLVARWPYGFSYETVRVAAGQESKVEVERSGPAEDARNALLAAVENREGIAAATKAAARAARLAQSEGVLLVAIKSDADAHRFLLTALHGANGDLLAIVRAELPGDVEDERTAAVVGRVGALLFVDKRKGELELSPDGTAHPAEQLAARLYEGVGTPAVTPPPPPPLDVEPPPPNPFPPPPPPPIAENNSVVQKWWFWTIIGVAAAGAGTGVAIWAGNRTPNRTNFQVLFP